MEGALALPRALPSQRRNFHWHHSGSYVLLVPVGELNNATEAQPLSVGISGTHDL